MNVRKFWLVNSLNEVYNLSQDKIFFYQPKGLGFGVDYASQKLGNSELLLSNSYSLDDVGGELLFMQDTLEEKYQKYKEFINFIVRKPLELHYQMPGSNEDYYSNVLFIQADKEEVKEDGILRIPCVFHRTTEWLTTKDYVLTLTNTALENGKEYPLVRPYHYAGSSLTNTKIENKGTSDTGFSFSIDGRVENPQFTLSQNGEVYGICKLDGTFDFVQIDSNDLTESIYLEYNGAFLSNPHSYQDFSIRNGISYLTWCKLKVGTSVFVFNCSNIDTFNGKITIIFKNSYVSV